MERTMSVVVRMGLVLILLVIVVAPGFAQDPVPSDDEVNRIAKQLYCPVCENIPLDVCPTQACAQWRATIREKLALGWNEEQVKQYFVDQYGDRVLATPPATGINWLVYILPPVVIIAGAAILLRTIKSWTKTRKLDVVAAGDTRSPVTDPYVRQLEDELRRRETS